MRQTFIYGRPMEHVCAVCLPYVIIVRVVASAREKVSVHPPTAHRPRVVEPATLE